MKFSNRLIPVFLISLFLVVLFGFYRNHALSFHFVDEEDNIVLGNYLLQKEKLYKDLFSHHQPLAYIFSAGVQKISTPPNLFMLIERHREAVLFWAITWTILLVARFGWPLFLFTLVFEPIKIFLLGHLFLSESLVVYPLVYILSFIFLKPPLLRLEFVLLGLSFSLIFFLLSPLWPAAIALGLIFFKSRNFKKQEIFLFSAGFFGVLLSIIPFVSIQDYFYNAFYLNLKYYIPKFSNGFSGTLQSFLAPFISLTIWAGRSATLQIIQFFSVFLIFTSFILIRTKEWKISLLIFVILGLVNLRFIKPGLQEYNGFHILPWFSSLVLLSLITAFLLIKNYPGLFHKLFLSIFLLITLILEFSELKQNLFTIKDPNKDFFINYSRQEDFGRAIKIMKKDGERLFVVPDEWLLYWQAGIGHYSKMVNYYAWMSKVPEIRNPLTANFAASPPTYFYCDKCEHGYFGLEKFFGRYERVKKDGKETNLMVLKEKVSTLSEKKIAELGYYNFTFGGK